MEHHVSFLSSGLKISAVLHVPEQASAHNKQAAIVVLHGFGSNKSGGISKAAAELFSQLGYVTLRFDMRGCGESEGQRGKVICLEQVQDTQAAIDFLQSRPEVDASRIGVMGHSFGAAVAVYTAGVDKRVAACISTGGWGDGEKKFRKQHASPEAWKKFTDMMAEGRKRLAQGESMMVPRYDIVPIQPGLRTQLAAGSILEFPYEVVESMYNFRANEVVGQIAPRPLLLVHPSNDTVTPTEQSIDLFAHAGQPTDLHLFANTDHFILGEGNAMVIELVSGWLRKNMPLHDHAH
jgi:alpha-beta hydrolase superfamily lysophospholipase